MRVICGRRFIAVLLCALSLPVPLLGFSTSGDATQPATITGRTFAGRDFALPPIDGQLSIRALRAYSWLEEPEIRDGSPAPPVRRLLLDGDVEIQLGLYRFTAARAVMWMRPVTVENRSAYQIFAYLDRAATPTAGIAVGVSGDRLPVRAIVLSDAPSLTATLVRPDRPDDDLVREGERVLAQFLRGVPIDIAPRARSQVTGVDPQDPALSRAFASPSGVGEQDRVIERLPGSQGETLFARDGVFSFDAGDRVRLVRDEDTGRFSAIFTGGLVCQYSSVSAQRRVQISAARGVVFLDEEGAESIARVGIEAIDGLYLEGDVTVTYDTPRAGGRGGFDSYTLRSPRVYYDLVSDRALLLDAVFWTYDERVGMPLYVRADVIRQEADDQFFAGNAKITNSGFAEPHLALGASQMTISRSDRAGEAGRVEVDARNITLRAGPIPFFYWPMFAGDPRDVPLRDLQFENTTGGGFAVKTGWDLLALLGMEQAGTLAADLLVDYYAKRGWAFGIAADWRGDSFDGELFAYGLPDDSGTDIMSSGTRIERDGGSRSILLGEQRWAIDNQWTLWLEGSYVSDEQLVESLFRDMAQSRREFTNRGVLERQDDANLLSLEAKAALSDFSPNQYIQQTPGYTVDRLPEASYTRVGDDVLPDAAPGLVTYDSESRIGQLALNFIEPDASEFGFVNPRLSMLAYGVQPDESIGDRLRAEGYTEDAIARFDTRHEVSANLKAGSANITSFVAGRFTGYSDDFEEFNGETDNYRLWGGVGTRVSTTLVRVDNGVESSIFDLHRIRHVVEPHGTIWYGGTTIDREDLPVYDDSVEGIGAGTAVHIGLDQTWQTKRGAVGRWYDADVLRLDIGYTYTSNDAERESPFGRWVDYRPELSNLGEYLETAASWQVTDSFALGATHNFDFETNQQASLSVGSMIEHSPEFSTWAELRYLNPQDSTLVGGGFDQNLPSKYAIGGALAYDTDRGEFRSIAFTLTRELPNLDLNFGVSHNEVTDETSLVLRVRPFGSSNPADAFGGRGRSSVR